MSVHGRLQTVHTQLLLRGGPRTPLWPLPPEPYWEATLPDEELMRRLRRAGTVPGGPRRSRVPRSTGLWGQFTTRGADEMFAAGRRLRLWLDNTDILDYGQEPAGVVASMLVPPGRRPELTARAVLRGFCLPGQEAVIDTVEGEILRVQLSPGFDGLHCAEDDVKARRAAAAEMSEALGMTTVGALGSSWQQLLDAAECARDFGLLPEGSLKEATWQTLQDAPRHRIRALLADRALAAEALAPFTRLLLEPSVHAAAQGRPASSPSTGESADEFDSAWTSDNAGFAAGDRLRICVLPGFSLLCWLEAIRLRGLGAWPSPSTCLLQETLLDDAGVAFMRFWQLRESWELRPAWHSGVGPTPLASLLEVVEEAVGTEGLPAPAGSVAYGGAPERGQGTEDGASSREASYGH